MIVSHFVHMGDWRDTYVHIDPLLSGLAINGHWGWLCAAFHGDLIQQITTTHQWQVDHIVDLEKEHI